jgi:multidrug efflux system membrane fusion protein
MIRNFRKNLAGSIAAIGRTRLVMFGLGLAFLAVMAVNRAADKPGNATPAAAPPTVRVETALAARRDVPVHAEGLGTVQAFYTVTVTPRVDGELLKLGFVEGQTVKPGDLLAQIDPRPYQAAFDQAIAAKYKDAAQLANAKRDLERYVKLAPEEFTSQQTLETQRALVAQLEAQVVGDQAVIDNARTQLDYTAIRSPIQGRTGIRMTDPGNILHAASATGIVVVTQLQPISLIFTLPVDVLPAASKAMAAGPVTVTALSRDGKAVLGEGTVGLIDNQIDQTTGTIRLKATFPNKDNQLWPGEFVNARVMIETRRNALTIPSSAVQRGPNGVFAYVVKADSTVEMRPLEIAEEAGASAGSIAVVEKGLQEGERVTTNNQYRLRPGIAVQVVAAAGAGGNPAGKP